MTDEQRTALSKHFDAKDISKRSDGRGGQLSYVSHGKVTERLIDVLGPDGWHWEELDMIQMQEEVVVKYRMGIPNEKGEIVWKTQYGSARVMYPKDYEGKPPVEHIPENIISLGDCLKSAVSDALKKCSSLHGVALHLYLDEDAPERQESRSGDERRTTGGSYEAGSGTGGASGDTVGDVKNDLMKLEKKVIAGGMTLEEVGIIKKGMLGAKGFDNPKETLEAYGDDLKVKSRLSPEDLQKALYGADASSSEEADKPGGSAEGGMSRPDKGKQSDDVDIVKERVKAAEKKVMDSAGDKEYMSKRLNDLRKQTMGSTSLDQDTFKLLNYEKAIIALQSEDQPSDKSSVDDLEDNKRASEGDE